MTGLPPLAIAAEASPDEATVRAIESGLNDYNQARAGDARWSTRWIVGRDLGGALQAGVRYVTAYDWLFAEWLWVAEAYRRRGVGSELLARAEATAREFRCRGAYLDKFTFQAPKFYEKHGYREFGRLDDFPPGHSRIWLAKTL